ncbi:MAG TPA: hypothetical protein VEW03_03865, partial [Longimicrobiaceae bacterium]|nr:hypothetical protein [Longimicrobiaceae bacterium]
FIPVQFPAMDAAFNGLVDAATGVHPRLSVVRTTLTDTFTNRGFASLNKTVTDVRSTLYGPLEQVRFTPALEAVDAGQFGIIRVETEGLTPRLPAGAGAAAQRAMLERGIVMRGIDAPSLGVPADGEVQPLTAALLEGFLAALLIRTD